MGESFGATQAKRSSIVPVELHSTFTVTNSTCSSSRQIITSTPCKCKPEEKHTLQVLHEPKSQMMNEKESSALRRAPLPSSSLYLTFPSTLPFSLTLPTPYLYLDMLPSTSAQSTVPLVSPLLHICPHICIQVGQLILDKPNCLIDLVEIVSGPLSRVSWAEKTND